MAPTVVLLQGTPLNILQLVLLLAGLAGAGHGAGASRLCSLRPCGYIEPRDRQATATDPFQKRFSVCVESLSCCGNGLAEAHNFEQCDHGPANNTWQALAEYGSTCRPDCRPARCGDSVVDPGELEECDSGDRNSNETTAACSQACAWNHCVSSPCRSGGGRCTRDCASVPGEKCCVPLQDEWNDLLLLIHLCASICACESY